MPSAAEQGLWADGLAPLMGERRRVASAAGAGVASPIAVAVAGAIALEGGREGGGGEGGREGGRDSVMYNGQASHQRLRHLLLMEEVHPKWLIGSR